MACECVAESGWLVKGWMTKLAEKTYWLNEKVVNKQIRQWVNGERWVTNAQWRKKNVFFQIIVTFFIFNIKKLCQHQNNL